MRKVVNVLLIVMVIGYLAIITGCAGAKAPETTPESDAKPSPEELRKKVDKDPAIYQAMAVIKKVGKLTQEHISYEKYETITKSQQGSVLDPTWFYDNYDLPLNKDGYWITVTFSTADKSIVRDPRIEKLMTDLPGNSITVNLKTPSGQSYILSDTEADGILDFAKRANEESVKQIDYELLDRMQEKYTWIISIIKKHYKKGM
jgi:hypothetical protein